jgi:phosphoglycolate phosphatase-like HAD superfamily hydrolase
MSRYLPKLSLDALIVSCNEVLIDVTLSYQAVVAEATAFYLERALNIQPCPLPILTPAEVVELQKVGQFTNYWDLTTAFVMYFVELLPPAPIPTFPLKFHMPALMAYLQIAGGNLHLSIDALLEKKDITRFALAVAQAGGGLNGAHKALPRENRHLLIASGSLTQTNLLMRVFQELYLGADLFENIYGEPAVIIQGAGYTKQESLVIDRDILAKIGQKVPLGIVSDRPRREVERSLKAANIDTLFQSVITLDDITQAKAKAIPDPWPLLEAARRLQPTPAHSAYIGANIGDIQAAQAANQTVPFTAIGCLIGANDKEALQKSFEQYKASVILGHPNHLQELILDP